MRVILIGFAVMAIALASCENKSSQAPEKSQASRPPKVVVEREEAGREVPLPPEVKIRLRRDGKDNYSWELNGSDADQILKVNEKLKKKIGEQK